MAQTQEHIKANIKTNAESIKSAEEHSDDDYELSEETKKWIDEIVDKSLKEMAAKPSINIVPLPPANYRQIAMQRIEECRTLYEARHKSMPLAPTLIRALRDYTNSKLPKIKSVATSLDKIENELYYYIFKDSVGGTELPGHEPLKILLTTPLHEAIIRGEEDIIEFLCQEYQKRGLINIDSVGQNQIETPLDFYVQYIELFGSEWSDEKRVRIFKILESYGAVAKKIPKIKEKDFDKIYKGLNKFILNHLQTFEDKYVVVVSGETHASKFSAFVEIMLLFIAKEDFAFQYHFLEANPERLKTYRSAPLTEFRAPQACVKLSDRIKLNVLPIDNKDFLREKDQTPAVINDRDYWMTYEILQTKCHGVATVGSAHLMGMAEHQQKLKRISDKHVFCFLNATQLKTSDTTSTLILFTLNAKQVLQVPIVGVEHLSIQEIELGIEAARNRFLAKHKKANVYMPSFDAKCTKEGQMTTIMTTMSTPTKSAASVPTLTSTNSSTPFTMPSIAAATPKH